ncbi:MAG: hypothetical protein ACI4DY_11880 [Monoglobaceae bacterium]
MKKKWQSKVGKLLLGCYVLTLGATTATPTFAASKSPEVITLEAEDPKNTLLGEGDHLAYVVDNPYASGGKVVGNLGCGVYGGRVVFNNVPAKQTGTYKLTVTYTGGTERAFDILVNGRDEYFVSCPITDANWQKTGEVSVDIVLEKGNNTIQFYRKRGDWWVDWESYNSPPLDKISYEFISDEVPVQGAWDPFFCSVSNGGNTFVANTTETGPYVRVDSDNLWVIDIRGGEEGNYVIMNNIKAPKTGRYEAVINFSNIGTLNMVVNDKDRYCCDFPWRVWGKIYPKPVYVTLNEGMNHIKLYSDTDAPLLNGITFRLVEELDRDINGEYKRKDKKAACYPIIREVEDPSAVMFGPDAKIIDNPAMSGGKAVENLGNRTTNEDGGNSVTFPDITVDKKGRYLFTFYYTASEKRQCDITVNGFTSYQIECQPTEGDKPVPQTVAVDLEAGKNMIMLSTLDWYVWAPTLDKIEVRPFAERTEGDNIYTPMSPGVTLDQTYMYLGTTLDKATAVSWQPGGSITFEQVKAPEDGLYTVALRYSALDPTSMTLTANGGESQKVMCYATGNNHQYDAARIQVPLKKGNNQIKVTLGRESIVPFDELPNLVDITIEGIVKKEEAAPQLRKFSNNFTEISYDTANGTYDVTMKGTRVISGVTAEANLEDKVVYSTDYTSRTVTEEAYADVIGVGRKITVANKADGLPEMDQIFYLYDGLPYILTELVLQSPDGTAANRMSPLTVKGGGVDIGADGDNRVARYLYCNESYRQEVSSLCRVFGSSPFDGEFTSYEQMALYDNDSRKGLILGSVEHDTWKTGIFYSGTGKEITDLQVYAGVTSYTWTYDQAPHGYVSGTYVKSPKIMIGYNADWRDGMIKFGEAVAKISPPLDWDGEPPIGWNSWGTYYGEMTYDGVIGVSDYIHDVLQPQGYSNSDGVAYVNLDAAYTGFWDKLPDYVQHCKDNGQKAGIYVAPYSYWGSVWLGEEDLDRKLYDRQTGEDIGSEYTFRDIVLKNPDGSMHQRGIGGDLALDPTHPGTKALVTWELNELAEMGFEFIKLDFLSNCTSEAKHYDPTVQTGTQAANIALNLLYEVIDGRMFIYHALSPYFPTQYAHSQLITSDIHKGDIGMSRIVLANLTYGGFFRSDNICTYTDSDIFVFEDNNRQTITDMAVNRTRLTSVAISGSTLVPGFDPEKPESIAVAEELLTNPWIVEITRLGKAFMAVEHTGDAFDQPSPVYVLENDNKIYVAVFNLSNETATIPVNFVRAGIDTKATFNALDIWSGKTESVSGGMNVTLGANDSTVLVLTK